MIEGFIYKIFNSKDNKIYVGRTIQPICRRLTKHRSLAKLNTHHKSKLLTHMRLIGPDNFSIEILEKKMVHCQCGLIKLERKWITRLNTVAVGLNSF